MARAAQYSKIAGIIILTGVSVVIWYAIFILESRGQNLRVSFFDIGQGDAALIQTPSGHTILVDGGPGNAVLDKLGRALPFWERTIDVVILTHPHADHLDGLIDVLKRYEVGMIVESGVRYDTPDYHEWERVIREKGITRVIAKAGQRMHMGDGVFLDVYTPFERFEGAIVKNVHDADIVARLWFGKSSVFFTGDAERLLEYRLMFTLRQSPFFVLPSDVLKVGHHGSRTSSSEDFFQAVAPRAAVISVGKKNRYGHPHEDVLTRLRAFDTAILRTDENGDVTFISDGVHYVLTAAR